MKENAFAKKSKMDADVSRFLDTFSDGTLSATWHEFTQFHAGEKFDWQSPDSAARFPHLRLLFAAYEEVGMPAAFYARDDLRNEIVKRWLEENHAVIDRRDRPRLQSVC